MLDRSAFAEPVNDLVDVVLESSISSGFGVDGPARFPIRVNLPDFADKLNPKSNSQTLLSYISATLAKEIDFEFKSDDLRTWFGTCPILLVLDGLDEVPPTANRQQVLKAIEGILDDLSLVRADALTIVTTRPQGYSQDLDPVYWEHWELTDLSPERSNKIAEKLAKARISDDELRSSVLLALSLASEDPSTKTLLHSPLQVAILFGISLLKGAIPNDRWDLFDRYYGLLRDREAQKPNSSVREYKRYIDAIHLDAGFVLQAEAERAGSSNPYLTPIQLEMLIKQHLEKDEYNPDDVKRITADLVRIATERLVLLATRTQDRITFDVRSLQEYMAAARISAVSKVPVSTKLRKIAARSHWRHVFRIVASRVFSTADLAIYRDDILSMCHAIDLGDYAPDEAMVHIGAELALDLLEDNIANDAPKYYRQFIKRALAVIDLGPDAVDARILRHLTDDTVGIFGAAIEDALKGTDSLSASSAWKLLALAYEVRPDWAEGLMLRYWPEDSVVALKVVEVVRLQTWPQSITNKAVRAQWIAGPSATFGLYEKLHGPFSSEDEASSISNLCALPPPWYEVNFSPGSILEFSTPFAQAKGQVVKTEKSGRFLFAPHQSNDAWAPLQQVALFAADPNKGTLAECLHQLKNSSKSDVLALNHARNSLPWVILSVLTDHYEGESLATLADEAQRGSFGDISDWNAAETRWAERGVQNVDILTWSDGRYLTSAIAKLGSPVFGLFRSKRNYDDLPAAVIAFEGIKSAPILNGMSAQFLVSFFNQFPSKRGILSVLVRSMSFSDYRKAPYLEDLDSSAFEFVDADSAGVRAAVAMLRVSRGNWGVSDVPLMAEALTYYGDGAIARTLSNLLRTDITQEHQARSALLTEIVGNLKKSGMMEVYKISKALNSLVNRQASEFADPQVAMDLALPVL